MVLEKILSTAQPRIHGFCDTTFLNLVLGKPDEELLAFLRENELKLTNVLC